MKPEQPNTKIIAAESIWVFYEFRWIRNKNWSNSIKSLSDHVTCYNSNLCLFCLNSVWGKIHKKKCNSKYRTLVLGRNTRAVSTVKESLCKNSLPLCPFYLCASAVSSEPGMRDTSSLCLRWNAHYFLFVSFGVSAMAHCWTKGDFCRKLLQNYIVMWATGVSAAASILWNALVLSVIKNYVRSGHKRTIFYILLKMNNNNKLLFIRWASAVPVHFKTTALCF